MMSASIDSKALLLRPVASDAAETPISRLLRVLAEEVGCAHEQLVFDEINDVYCKHCRKDFTG